MLAILPYQNAIWIALVKLSQASILLPVLTGLMNYKRLTLPFKILFYFFLATIGFELQATILGAIYHNNLPGLHLFTVVEFMVFSLVYYLHFRKNNTVRLLISINAIVFIVVALADALFIHNIWANNTLARSYAAVSLISYTLIYLHFMFRIDDAEYSSKHPMFWISIGTLIYFGCNSMYFLLYNNIINNTAAANISLYTYTVFNIISNCLYAQSFRCFNKHKAIL